MTKKESVANLKQIVQDESSSETEKLLATSLIDVYHRIGKLGGNDQWCADHIIKLCKATDVKYDPR